MTRSELITDAEQRALTARLEGDDFKVVKSDSNRLFISHPIKTQGRNIEFGIPKRHDYLLTKADAKKIEDIIENGVAPANKPVKKPAEKKEQLKKEPKKKTPNTVITNPVAAEVELFVNPEPPTRPKKVGRPVTSPVFAKILDIGSIALVDETPLQNFTFVITGSEIEYRGADRSTLTPILEKNGITFQDRGRIVIKGFDNAVALFELGAKFGPSHNPIFEKIRNGTISENDLTTFVKKFEFDLTHITPLLNGAAKTFVEKVSAPSDLVQEAIVGIREILEEANNALNTKEGITGDLAGAINADNAKLGSKVKDAVIGYMLGSSGSRPVRLGTKEVGLIKTFLKSAHTNNKEQDKGEAKIAETAAEVQKLVQKHNEALVKVQRASAKSNLGQFDAPKSR